MPYALRRHHRPRYPRAPDAFKRMGLLATPPVLFGRGGICSFVGKLPYGLCQNGVLGPRQVGKVAKTIGFDRAPHTGVVLIRHHAGIENSP
jgi:hypothetical protein